MEKTRKHLLVLVESFSPSVHQHEARVEEQPHDDHHETHEYMENAEYLDGNINSTWKKVFVKELLTVLKLMRSIDFLKVKKI